MEAADPGIRDPHASSCSTAPHMFACLQVASGFKRLPEPQPSHLCSGSRKKKYKRQGLSSQVNQLLLRLFPKLLSSTLLTAGQPVLCHMATPSCKECLAWEDKLSLAGTAEGQRHGRGGVLGDTVPPQGGHADPGDRRSAPPWSQPGTSPQDLCGGHVSKNFKGPWEPPPRPEVSRQHPGPGGPGRGAGRELLGVPADPQKPRGVEGTKGLRDFCVPGPLPSPNQRGGPMPPHRTDGKTRHRPRGKLPRPCSWRAFRSSHQPGIPSSGPCPCPEERPG